ncbi:MAG TPA: DUF4149 domain-containing protein [Myxococcota bacterium]|nr:DUF4149 domain-containing protein [Myxococcota bacterium]
MTVRPARGVALRSALWLALGGWVGSWALFALVIARLAFQVLPSPEIAGHLVRPVLNVLHWYGVAAGVLLAVLAAVLERGLLLVGLPLAMAVACLVTQLGVTPRLEAIRDLAFGPAGNLEAAAQYRHLHGISMAIFSVVLVGAIALVVLHVRREVRRPTADSKTRENTTNFLG